MVLDLEGVVLEVVLGTGAKGVLVREIFVTGGVGRAIGVGVGFGVLVGFSDRTDGEALGRGFAALAIEERSEEGVRVVGVLFVAPDAEAPCWALRELERRITAEKMPVKKWE